MALTTMLLSAFAAFGGLVAGAACCQAVLRRQDGKARGPFEEKEVQLYTQ